MQNLTLQFAKRYHNIQKLIRKISKIERKRDKIFELVIEYFKYQLKKRYRFLKREDQEDILLDLLEKFCREYDKNSRFTYWVIHASPEANSFFYKLNRFLIGNLGNRYKALVREKKRILFFSEIFSSHDNSNGDYSEEELLYFLFPEARVCFSNGFFMERIERDHEARKLLASILIFLICEFGFEKAIIFYLIVYKGWKYSELSKKFGYNENTLKTWISRMKKKIHQKFYDKYKRIVD